MATAVPIFNDEPSRFEHLADLRLQFANAGEDELPGVLSRLAGALAVDEAFLLLPASEPSDTRFRLWAGTTSVLDSNLADVLTWPAVARAIRRSEAFLSGTSEGASELSSDERRRLWARGLSSIICVPLRPHQLESGALLLCARRGIQSWDAGWMAALRHLADAIHERVRRSPPQSHDPRPPSDRTPAESRLPVARVTSPASAERGTIQSSREDSLGDSVGDSAAWRYVMFRVDQVAATHATVLLMGETGTGKEVVARAIHRRSPRSSARFVALNSAALPATLVESELFGRERGAFTGAHTSQPGRFELAHHGTLFLDELGDFPVELQPKLLRVLQEGQLERLGGTRTIDVDVRVIAATNRDLAEDVRLGRFRQDLYYRLNVFPITMPSLRDRREDIPLLAWHFVERFGRALNKPIERIPESVMQALQSYDWPGNIRELENVIQRAIIISSNRTLSINDIALPLGRSGSLPTGTSLAGVEREHILRVLELSSWRIEGRQGAAHLLGLKPSTLRSRLRKLQVERPA